MFSPVKQKITAFSILLLFWASFVSAQLQDSSFQPLITTSATVTDLIPGDNGTLIVSGNFQFVNGKDCFRVVRLLPDGTKDPSFTVPFTDTIITALHLQMDGNLLGGGYVPKTNENDELGIVLRLLPDGSFDPTFQASTFNDRVLTLAQLDDQTILVGGLFSKHANVHGSGLAELHIDGSLRQMLQFEPSDTTNITDIYQIEILPDHSGYYATGNRGFEAFIHRFSPTGIIDSSFIVQTTFESGDFLTSIQDIVLDDDGNPWFTAYTWQFNPQLISIDQSGNILANWDIPNPQDLVLSENQVPIVATVLDGQPDVYTLANNELIPFADGPAADEIILHILPRDDGSLVAAGRFSFYKGFPFESIMQFTPNGQPDLSFFTRLQRSGIVRKVQTLDDGRILIGGLFTQINQKEAIHLAQLLPDGTLDPSFALNTIPREHSVNDLIVQPNGSILVATNGPRLNERPYFPIQRLSPNGQPDPSFSTGLEAVTLGDVLGIVMINSPNDTFIVGYGTYSFTLEGQRISRIARFSYSGQVNMEFSDLIKANKVNDIFAYSNGKMLLGGENISVGGATTQSLVRVFPRGNLDGSFLPELNKTSEVSKIFELNSTKLMISGQLNGLGSYTSLSRLFPDGRIDRTFSWIPNDPNREPTSWPRTVIPMASDSFLISNRPGEGDALFLQMDRRGELSEAYRPDYSFYTGDIHLVNDTTLLVAGNFVNPVGGSGLMRFFLNQDPPNSIITSGDDIAASFPVYPYPNPTTDGSFFLTTPQDWLDQTAVSVIDINGKEVLRTTLPPGMHEIRIPQKKSGIYVLRLQQRNKHAHGLIIVQPMY